MCFSPKEVRHQTASMYYAFAVDALTNLLGKSVELPKASSAKTKGSYVLATSSRHAPSDAAQPKDWSRHTILLWSNLHPLLCYSYRADHVKGWKAKVARPEVAYHVDHNRVLDR